MGLCESRFFSVILRSSMTVVLSRCRPEPGLLVRTSKPENALLGLLALDIECKSLLHTRAYRNLAGNRVNVGLTRSAIRFLAPS